MTIKAPGKLRNTFPSQIKEKTFTNCNSYHQIAKFAAKLKKDTFYQNFSKHLAFIFPKRTSWDNWYNNGILWQIWRKLAKRKTKNWRKVRTLGFFQLKPKSGWKNILGKTAMLVALHGNVLRLWAKRKIVRCNFANAATGKTFKT